MNKFSNYFNNTRNTSSWIQNQETMSILSNEHVVAPAPSASVADTESQPTDEKYALPLCLRKLHNRNQDIVTKEDRLKIRKAYIDANGVWQYSNHSITPERPRFLLSQCLVRFVWRVVFLDNLIARKVAYLFTLAGAVVVTITTTLMFNVTTIEASQLQSSNSTTDTAGERWSNWLMTFWLLLLAVVVIAVLEFIYFTYKKWFLTTQQLLKQERFEYAMSKYTSNNPFGPEYINEYNSANDQDPDAVIMWLMDDEESFERKAENQNCGPRCTRSCRRFTLLDYIDRDPDPRSLRTVDQFLYCCCLCFRNKRKR